MVSVSSLTSPFLLTNINDNININNRNNTNNCCHQISISNIRPLINVRQGSLRALNDVAVTIVDQPAQAQVTWQIVVGALAGVTPFIVAGIEFSKRIAAQRRCEVCGGSGLVLRDNKYYFRCPACDFSLSLSLRFLRSKRRRHAASTTADATAPPPQPPLSPILYFHASSKLRLEVGLVGNWNEEEQSTHTLPLESSHQKVFGHLQE